MVIQNIITLPDKSDKAIILQTPINCGAVKENELISVTHRDRKESNSKIGLAFLPLKDFFCL